VQVESAEASEKGTPGPGQLEAFWSGVVEGDLFLSSHERKFLGFQLFTLLLPFLGWVVPSWFPRVGVGEGFPSLANIEVLIPSI